MTPIHQPHTTQHAQVQSKENVFSAPTCLLQQTPVRSEPARCLSSHAAGSNSSGNLNPSLKLGREAQVCSCADNRSISPHSVTRPPPLLARDQIAIRYCISRLRTLSPRAAVCRSSFFLRVTAVTRTGSRLTRLHDKFPLTKCPY